MPAGTQADGTKSVLVDVVGSLATVFSPAKLAILVYAFLVYRGHPVSVHLKYYVLLFVVLDVLHTDFLRLALNGLGRGLGDRWRRWAAGKKI